MELVEKVKNIVNLPKKRMKKTELLDFFEQSAKGCFIWEILEENEQ